MSYMALYRKFRPNEFEDVKGQDAIVRTLKNQIEADRIGHAYLFCGTRGTGKTTVAKIFAKAVNCEHPVDGSPCGECAVCKAIAAGNSMNVIEIDAASNNGVDNIREIREEVAYRPTEGRYKVYIIDEVHMLSIGAFNALLKTLEEPPAHVKFIFATTEIRKVPVTILSRCQRFDLQRLSVETLTQLFTKILANENIPAETEALDIIAKAADGSARDGLSLLDQAIVLSNGNINTDVVKKMLGLADRSQTLTLFENLVNGNMEAVLKDISEQYTNGATPMIVLQDLINITHDLAKVKIIPALLNSTSLSEIEKKTFATLSTSCSLAVLSKIWQMLIKGISEINMAPSAVEALEMILLRVAYSASLPTPYEILNEVKKNSDLAGTSSVYSGQSALLQNSAAAVPVSVPPSGTEKKNDLTATVSAGETSGFNTVEDLLRYLEGTKKALIEYSIKHDVCIREFSDGHIAMNIAPSIHQDFIMNLHKLLSEATGRQWEIEIIKGDLGETIADKEKSAAEATKKNVSEYPLVKKILEEFKGAKIETVIRKNLEELAENEPDIPGDTVPVTYFEEEE